MSSKRRVRRRACEGKQRYASSVEGNTAIWSVSRKGYKGHMQVYKCKFCGSYHIGRAPAYYAHP